MRNFYLLISLLCSTSILFAQAADAGILSSRLQQALRENPEALHHISILLTDRLDVRAMDHSFYQHQVSLTERSHTLITALKAKAANTQQSILNLLTASEDVDPQSIQAFWITNVIFFKGKQSMIERLSRLPEVEWLDLNGTLVLEEHVDVACGLTTAPGTAEPGLKAIKADQLWQMGYTGFGTIAMGADTGIDPTHPALSGNWRARSAPQVQSWFDPNDPDNTYPANCGDHGTHTLGTILGIDRVNEDTVGVAFNAQWIGTNVLCGNGTQANIAAFQWSLDPDNNPMTIHDMPNVINNSWYDPEIAIGEDCMSAYVDVLNTLEAAGIAIVFSAGNNGSGQSTLTAPKNINTDLVNIMSVGALNANNASLNLAGFSSRGPSTCGGAESLLIKPEVSAPGVDIRSCTFDGGYNLKSGTSMAAPHVCGAILLLKEAFPELTGTEIKLALYFSASDLGTSGEDNDYGMGIINVWEAFNYLLAQGHTPSSPMVEHDVLLIDIDAQVLNCDGIAVVDLIIENGGTQNLTSTTIQYQLTANGEVILDEVFEWTGGLAMGERSIYNMVIDELPEGIYEISATLSDPNGMMDARELNNKLDAKEILIFDESPLEIKRLDQGGDFPCVGSNTYLAVDYDSPAAVRWYFSETGGTPIAEGPMYLVPELFSDFTFYAEAEVTNRLGITNIDSDNSLLGDSNEGALVFDVYAPFRLKSVKVYAEEPGFRLLILKDAEGLSISNKVLNISELGEQRIDLDFEIPEGTGYSLEIDAGPPFLHSSQADYPYSLGNIVSINQSGDFVDPQSNYYYFYDWEIVHNHVCGRIPYQLSYQPTDLAPEADFEASAETVSVDNGVVSFTNNSTNAQQYHWDFGDGHTSLEENPVHTYTEEGTYTVLLTVLNSEGCSDVAILTIDVASVLAIQQLFDEQNIKIHPNPTWYGVLVSFQFNNAQEVQMELRDLLGRKVSVFEPQRIRTNQVPIDLTKYDSGVYFLVCQINDQKIVKRIIKMD